MSRSPRRGGSSSCPKSRSQLQENNSIFKKNYFFQNMALACRSAEGLPLVLVLAGDCHLVHDGAVVVEVVQEGLRVWVRAGV